MTPKHKAESHLKAIGYHGTIEWHDGPYELHGSVLRVSNAVLSLPAEQMAASLNAIFMSDTVSVNSQVRDIERRALFRDRWSKPECDLEFVIM